MPEKKRNEPKNYLKGLWSVEEDKILLDAIKDHGNLFKLKKFILNFKF